MDSAERRSRSAVPHSAACLLLSVLAFLLAIPLGILMADALLQYGKFTVSVQFADPYAGCALAVEYAVRAARLCLPTVLYTAGIWAAAYVRFEKLLLSLLFFLRGIACTAALYLSLTLSGGTLPLVYISAHLLITLILLGLVFCVRERDGIRPFPDSLTAMLIAGGASALAVVLSSLLFPYF